jgi:hypothetical protein
MNRKNVLIVILVLGLLGCPLLTVAQSDEIGDKLPVNYRQLSAVDAHGWALVEVEASVVHGSRNFVFRKYLYVHSVTGEKLIVGDELGYQVKLLLKRILAAVLGGGAP